MARFKIGVMVDSFRIPIPEGVKKAHEIGAEGLQVYTARGAMAPDKLDKAARQAFRALVESNGLAISALCGDLGGCGFMLASENEEKITRSKAIVDLAVELGTNVVTTHIGHVPETNDSPYYQNELLVCRILGEYAEKRGVTFAIETGPETSVRLAAFLNDVGSAGIGVNLDPANLIMVQNESPVEAVNNLAPFIVHTHAKDGEHYQDFNPAMVYGAPGEKPVNPVEWSKYFREVPLGDGSVPWDAYLDALAAHGFHGFLTVERECGANPEADIRKAVDFLRAKV